MTSRYQGGKDRHPSRRHWRCASLHGSIPLSGDAKRFGHVTLEQACPCSTGGQGVIQTVSEQVDDCYPVQICDEGQSGGDRLRFPGLPCLEGADGDAQLMCGFLAGQPGSLPLRAEVARVDHGGRFGHDVQGSRGFTLKDDSPYSVIVVYFGPIVGKKVGV